MSKHLLNRRQLARVVRLRLKRFPPQCNDCGAKQLHRFLYCRRKPAARTVKASRRHYVSPLGQGWLALGRGGIR